MSRMCKAYFKAFFRHVKFRSKFCIVYYDFGCPWQMVQQAQTGDIIYNVFGTWTFDSVFAGSSSSLHLYEEMSGWRLSNLIGSLRQACSIWTIVSELLWSQLKWSFWPHNNFENKELESMLYMDPLPNASGVWAAHWSKNDRNTKKTTLNGKFTPLAILFGHR